MAERRESLFLRMLRPEPAVEIFFSSAVSTSMSGKNVSLMFSFQWTRLEHTI